MEDGEDGLLSIARGGDEDGQDEMDHYEEHLDALEAHLDDLDGHDGTGGVGMSMS